MIHERELDLRQRRFAQIRSAMRASLGEGAASAVEFPERKPYQEELLEQLAQLRADRDIEAFRSAMDRLSRRPGLSQIFPGFNFGVAMFVNQLVKASPDADALTELLLATMAPPSDDADADKKLGALLSHVEVVREGAQPAPKNAVTLLSFFWWLQQPTMWPLISPASEVALRKLGWLRTDLAPAELYPAYRQAVRPLHEDDALVEETLRWFNEHPWTGADATLFARLEWAELLDKEWDGQRYPEGVGDTARTNIAAALAEMRLLGDHLETRVSDAVRRELRRHVAHETVDRFTGRCRTNVWTKWKMRDSAGWNEAPSIMVLVTAAGVQIGLSPGRRQRGWSAAIRHDLEAVTPPELSFWRLWANEDGGVPVEGGEGEYIIGRFFESDSVPKGEALADQIVAVAAAAQPVLDRAVTLAEDVPPPPPPPPDPEIAALFKRFLAEEQYPTKKDEAARAHRAEFAAYFQPEVLPELDLADFQRVFNSSHYGFAGNQSMLNVTLRDAGPGMVDRVIALLQVLLWGKEPVEQRIDRCLDLEDLGIRGLGEAVVMKLLAVCHPDRFLPVFPLAGENGKLALLSALGESAPDAALGRGARQVHANDRLRSRLESFLPDDPRGQVRFAYWVRNHLVAEVDDPLDAVVDDCYMPDRTFVDELVDLLEDKRQIVLYGPPGTGKTFIARKLAEALAPGEQLRRFVQFHPSTSYEDFFEGYRPSADASGNLSYSLESGPFADLADHAAQDPRRHVLVIDELNRANIPKVFGELLFLLEYRDESVVPLYRPEFSLPENLWVIATMNTADRSIASLDAALRRRFHFVPIFPDDGPMEGLLGRYLERNGGDPQWAQLLSMVNAELRERLGNGDLLIGPSHFLKRGLDENAMDRIWRYNVEPFIDDLFYGDRAAISEFRWAAVLDRFRNSIAATAADPTGPATVGVNDAPEDGPIHDEPNSDPTEHTSPPDQT